MYCFQILLSNSTRARAVQVDSIKSRLESKRLWSQRLKVQYDELLSTVAFKFNLRRYSVGHAGGHAGGGAARRGGAVQIDPVKPMLKAPGTKHLKLKFDKLLSSFDYKFNLRRYTEDGGRCFSLAQFE